MISKASEYDTINVAFNIVFSDKMRSDGYYDATRYIKAILNKHIIKDNLNKGNPVFKKLFKNKYAKNFEEIDLTWKKIIGEESCDISTNLEADSIVLWVFKSIKTEYQRKLLLLKLLGENTPNIIKENKYIFYYEEKVCLYFVNDINSYMKVSKELIVNDRQTFFRGHSMVNYVLQPSIFRNEFWEKNESNMYNEIMRLCPANFSKCKTRFEKLAEMQHYGLPTRLLDISYNPLVALYFACLGEKKISGEIIVFSINTANVKYFHSDSVSIISVLSGFDYESQKEICKDACKCKKVPFNKKNTKLLHAIKEDKAYFQAEIEPADISKVVVVHALSNNERIAKQSGAFIVCGLINFKSDKASSKINELRAKKDNKTAVIIIGDKTKMEKELNNFEINQAYLFPEIDTVSNYISEKYKTK